MVEENSKIKELSNLINELKKYLNEKEKIIEDIIIFYKPRKMFSENGEKNFFQFLEGGLSVKFEKFLKEIFKIQVYKEITIENILYGENKESKRVSLYHFLYGRRDRNKKGLLEMTNSKVIRKNPLIISVPLQNYEKFISELLKFVNYRMIKKIRIKERTIIVFEESEKEIIP